MRPALLTEFSLLKHSQTFRIWDWAPHDIFPKSRLVMVAESSGRRSMRSSAPLSQPFRLCDRVKWKRGSVSAQLIYYSMTKGWSESCGQRGCSKSETLIGALSWPQNSDPSDPKWKLCASVLYFDFNFWSMHFVWDYITSLSLATTPTLCYILIFCALRDLSSHNKIILTQINTSIYWLFFLCRNKPDLDPSPPRLHPSPLSINLSKTLKIHVMTHRFSLIK